MSRNAFIFPGQGSQYIGMGKDFFDNFNISKQIFEQAEDLLKYKLANLVFNGPKDILSLTENSQLAIFVNSIAILKAIEYVNPSFAPQVCAGLSLGEYSALFASKKLNFEELILLIQKRARYMDEACRENHGTMAAVLGINVNVIKAIIEEIEDVWIANINTPAQIVIAGKKSSIEKACVLLKENKAKTLMLNVQGAFHTPYMKLAEDKLKQDILITDFIDSDVDIVMNFTAAIPQDIGNLKTNLIKQITSTVKWADSIIMIDEKVDLFIEIGCGKTLTNMNKKMQVKANSISIEKIEDLKEVEKNVKK